jgi:molecular chaperone DnaK
MRVINEPTASALAYGLNKMQERSVILVYDLGGGTFDVSILEINDGVFEVLATCGNNRLGGDDFDQCLIDWMKAEFLQMHNIDLSSDRMAMQRLKEAAEKAKIELSNTIETDINLPFLAGDATGPKHLQTTLSRTQFNALTAHLIESTFGPVQTALEDSGLTPENLEHIVLVGGSTRIPAVQEGIRRFFGKEPAKSVNPDEAVALGAAIQGSIIGGDGPDVLLLDVMSLSLGIETAGGIFTKIIERNTTVPTSRSMMFTTSEDGQSSVEVHVLQGERELAKYNKSLARFHLTGIPRAPRGVPQIEVTFEIDADGIVQVVAKDAASGITQAITIERSANLDPDEVARLQKEAEEYASQDQELKERIRVRIQAESLVSEAGRTIEKYGQKVESALLDKIASYLSTVKDLLSKEEIKAEELKAAVDRLDSSLLELGRAIYSSSRKGARNDSNGGDNNDLEDQVGEKTTGATS